MKRPMTVNELIIELMNLRAAGKGKYVIFLSDDEEGNGFHGCWYGPEAADTMDFEHRESVEECNYDLHVLTDKDKAVYLG